MPVSLLLVDPDAERIGRALAAALSGTDIVPVESVGAARAYLAGTRFDAVVVRDDDTGMPEALSALAAVLGVPGGVHVYPAHEAEQLAAWLGPRLGLPLVPERSDTSATESSLAVSIAADRPPTPSSSEVDREAMPAHVYAALVALRAEIGVVAHDLANPLAVVVGNAQLGSELVRAMGADEGVAKAFADIEEAGQVLAERLRRLAALRAHLDALM